MTPTSGVLSSLTSAVTVCLESTGFTAVFGVSVSVFFLTAAVGSPNRQSPNKLLLPVPVSTVSRRSPVRMLNL